MLPGTLALCLIMLLPCALVVGYIPDYTVYHSHDGYVRELLQLEASSPSLIRLQQLAEPSVEGLPIHLVKLSNWKRPWALRDGDRITKPKLLLVFGEHARELVTVESFLFLVKNLTEGFHQPCSDPAGQFSRFVMNNLELHLIGLLNPDGKRRLESTGDMCWRNNARGVDLNRNADWEFGGARLAFLFLSCLTGFPAELLASAGPGSSPKKDSEEYNGGAAFSEPESRGLRALVAEHSYTAYVSVHSGEQQLFVPFVDTESQKQRRRRHWDSMRAAAERAAGRHRRRYSQAAGAGAEAEAEAMAGVADSLEQGALSGRDAFVDVTAREVALIERIVRESNGYFHNSGIAYEMNSYSADGALFDWLGGREHVPYVVCAEVYGGPELPSCFEQFNPANERLAETLRSVHALFASLLRALIEDQTSARLHPITTSADSAAADLSAEAETSRRRSVLQRLCQAEDALDGVLADSLQQQQQQQQPQQAQRGGRA